MIGLGGVGVYVCSHTFMIMISKVQRKIALGSGNSVSVQPLYNTIEITVKPQIS